MGESDEIPPPSLSELVERELRALRAVDGVTSAKAYERQRREPLNKSMVSVRVRGRSNAITVHCKLDGVHNLVLAAQRAAELLASELGDEAVAQGRLRAEAEAEQTNAEQPGASGPNASAPKDLFERMAREASLKKRLTAAESIAREADGRVKLALAKVAEEERAVREAQHRLATARAAAEEAKQPLLEAAANIAGIQEELRLLRSKRPRLGDVAAPAPAATA